MRHPVLYTIIILVVISIITSFEDTSNPSKTTLTAGGDENTVTISTTTNDVEKKEYNVGEIFENAGMDLTIQEIVMNVRKFDYKNDSGIRLYFLKTKNDEMILILIDLYHLVFVSSNRDIKTEYERRKKYSYDLNNIIF